MHYKHTNAFHAKRTGLLLFPKDQFAPHLREDVSVRKRGGDVARSLQTAPKLHSDCLGLSEHGWKGMCTKGGGRHVTAVEETLENEGS